MLIQATDAAAVTLAFFQLQLAVISNGIKAAAERGEYTYEALWADDNADLNDYLLSALESAGYRVHLSEMVNDRMVINWGHMA